MFLAATGLILVLAWLDSACCGSMAGVVVLSSGDVARVQECEPIAMRMCRPVLRYNGTASPTGAGREWQQDVEQVLGTFRPLLRYGCSSRLRFLLCATFVPLCSEKVRAVVGPCRPLCEHFRGRCDPVLNRFGFRWPSSLDCSRLPPQNDREHMCMDGPAAKDSDIRSTRPATGRRLATRRGAKSTSTPATDINRPDAATTSGSGCSRVRTVPTNVSVNRCSPSCHEPSTFTAGEKKFAEVWLTIWSVPCFISTLFTVSSFLLDSSRSQSFSCQFSSI